MVLEVDGGGEEEREYFESGVHPKHACCRKFTFTADLVENVQIIISQSLSQNVSANCPHTNLKCLLQTFLAAVAISKICWLQLLNEEQEEKEVLLFASFLAPDYFLAPDSILAPAG